MTAARDKRVVVLCGFMGTGKTLVGRALARRLGVTFVDTDAVIEEREGMSVADIFDKRGEAYFRELESDVCRGLKPGDGLVVATGGGMVMDPKNLLHLQSLGTTVLLEATVPAIVARVGGNADRPMLAGASDAEADGDLEARVRSLLDARMPVYRQCELRIDTTRRTPEETAHDIAEVIDARPRRMIHLRVDTRPIPGRDPDVGNTRLSRVIAGQGAASAAAAWLERMDLKSAVVLSPRNVFDLHGDRVGAPLTECDIGWSHITVDDGDAAKTMAQVSALLDALADAGAGRDTALLALGGGVTGDVAGFVASVYMRGMPLVQIPSTLLAQVDASIGGKTGVNHARAKNLIGAVYQPHLVLSDPALLATLPPRELANGMAEVIKTAVIGSPELWETLSDAARTGRAVDDPTLLETCVAECARVKAGIVEEDPYERDRRRVLNLGHTLGHALESALSYAGLSHGEAVGLGLLAAWGVAVSRGVADASSVETTRAMLQWAGLPTVVPPTDTATVIAALRLDKKRRDGRMVFVLPVAPGDVRVVDDVTEDELLAAMAHIDQPKGTP